MAFRGTFDVLSHDKWEMLQVEIATVIPSGEVHTLGKAIMARHEVMGFSPQDMFAKLDIKVDLNRQTG